MKFFFTVFVDREANTFRRASFSDENPISQRRHVRDHEAVSLEFEVGRPPEDPMAHVAAHHQLYELLGRALLALPPSERIRIARESQMNMD
jgi:hypothetical protein